MSETHPFILTKVIATIGPACADEATLARLIDEGVRVVRINFSHGRFDDFAASLATIRAASQRMGVPVGVLGDLSGPKIRLEQVEGGRIDLEVGDMLEFVERGTLGYRDPATDAIVLPSTYPKLVREVEPGHRVLLDDGNVRTLATQRVEEGGAARLRCRVTQAGPLSNKKGINLPDTDISVPALTDYDRQCAQWAVENGLDFLALSFVRHASDVDELRVLLKTLKCRDMPIIAKLEKPQAMQELEGICDRSDALMVARGDLGVEMDLAEVPVLQRRIMQVAHAHGRPVIVATQMLQSMIEQGSPTRAEVSDVANAIFDGADAVMLSGETAVGRYPQQAVQVMARTARKSESYLASQRESAGPAPKKAQESRYRTAALAHGVAVVVHDLEARYVVMWSELGGGARYLSQNRLAVPIIAISSNTAALRKMSLYFGVVPLHMPRPADAPAFLGSVDELLLGESWAEQGDPIVIAKGDPLGIPGVTNEIRVHYVGDVCRLTWHAKEPM